MIVSTAELKEQLNISDDLGTDDDALIARTIAAAQGLIERQLGFAIETTYPDSVPAPLHQAVCLLAAHWYENREGSLIGVTGQELPFGIREIVGEYREYSFDG